MGYLVTITNWLVAKYELTSRRKFETRIDIQTWGLHILFEDRKRSDSFSVLFFLGLWPD